MVQTDVACGSNREVPHLKFQGEDLFPGLRVAYGTGPSVRWRWRGPAAYTYINYDPTHITDNASLEEGAP